MTSLVITPFINEWLHYPLGMCIDGNNMYVTNTDDTISLIDIPTKKLTRNWLNMEADDIPAQMCIDGNNIYVVHPKKNTIT